MAEQPEPGADQGDPEFGAGGFDGSPLRTFTGPGTDAAATRPA
jgi:hypothetical protein